MVESKHKESQKEQSNPSKGGGALLVAAGIFLSRIMGLVRQKIFAFYFGNSDYGDAFYAALKIPNFLQNLLGDGVLSASFIPVYTQLKSRGYSKEADRVAGFVGSLLALMTSLISAMGVWATPLLIDVIAPGFVGEKKELTILLVQIFFPGTALLVMSAWCLGILNSHRKFFLSYAAPVVWNLAIIGALVFYGSSFFGYHQEPAHLVVTAAWSVFVGSCLQFFVQIPSVLAVAKNLKWGLHLRKNSSEVQSSIATIFKNFIPVVFSRGVVQLSAYIDNVIASWLPTGAVSALSYAQSLYMLPISLFGMSVSAAELTRMSEAHGTEDEISQVLKNRLVSGVQQISFFVIPSVMGFWIIGDVIIRVLYRGGEFDENAVRTVWYVLIGSSVGLLATTLGRLYSSAFYSLKDTRTPLNFSILRVFLTTSLGAIGALYGPSWFGLDKSWGTVGLTATAGFAGWIEFLLLRSRLHQKIGRVELPKFYLIKAWVAATFSGLGALLCKFFIGHRFIGSSFMELVLEMVIFGFIYLLLAIKFNLGPARDLLAKIQRRYSRLKSSN